MPTRVTGPTPPPPRTTTTPTASTSTTSTTSTTPSTPVARPDPLALRLANGTSFSPVDRAALEAEAAKALKLGADVPGRVQDGPTCGLYALGMVMDYWDKKDPKNKKPDVQLGDAVRWDARNGPADTPELMLNMAKAAGYTTQGEMFYASQLAKVARHYGYHTRVRPYFSLDELKASLDRGHPALVGFDVDDVGNPGLFGGKRAHWAVIEGHFQKDGVEYLVATHGWTGKEYVWRADDFMKSVKQLDTSDFPAAPKDIRRTIKHRMVEVWP